MRKGVRLVVAVVGLSWMAGWAAAEPESTQEQRIGHFVHLLGSKRYAERESATRALEAMGPAALEELRQAARGRDSEIATRAADLIERIARRTESNRLLTPRSVHLVCQNTPVEQAVADLARHSGLPVVLEGNRTSLAGKRLTLDTGETTFWRALDQLTHQAGLAERSPAAVNPYTTNVTDRRQIQVFNLQRESMYQPVPNDERIVLTDGPSREMPTAYVGALRIRALLPTTAVGQARFNGETQIGLEISAEPRMGWQGVLDFRIDRALDEQGQLLDQTRTNLATSSPEAQFQQAFQVPSSSRPASGQGIAWARLKLADQPSRRLSELRGTLTVQVQTPVTPLLTVDNVLTSEGQLIRGDDNGCLKIHQVRLVEMGTSKQYKIKLQFENLPDGVVGPQGFTGVVRFAGGRAIGASAQPWLDPTCWTLYDDQQKPLQTLPFVTPGNINGNNLQEATLQFQATGEQKPAKLVFAARRSVVMDVPFTLKDVPLP